MKPIRVLLADDHALVRAGIRSLLESLGGIRVIAEAGDGREALDLIREHRPNVVLMDIAMPGMNGLEALGHVTKEFQGVRVVVLSMHPNEEYVQEAMRAGAAGYLLKNSSPEELGLCLRAVAKGEMYFSPRVSKHVILDYRRRLRGEEPPAEAENGPFQVPDSEAAGGLAVTGGGAHDVRDRANSVRYCENSGDAPDQVDEASRHPRHCGPGALCYKDGTDHIRRIDVDRAT